MKVQELFCLLLFFLSVCVGEDSLHDLFYRVVNSRVPCFRLTNATHQIGCSASGSHTRGVLYYMDDLNDLLRLRESSPHAPYIVLMEPEFFRGNGSIVRSLHEEPAVAGIILRYDVNFTANPESASSYFSPENNCPNDGYGESSSCGQNGFWNPTGNSLLYDDFGDFPIFVLNSDEFDKAVECHSMHNNGSSGGYSDFPLCSVELTADMAVAGNTPSCFRRRTLPIPYLYGKSFCDPLGDQSVWGSLNNLSQSDDQVIMLSAKLDSVSFFPSSFSFGASSEVAAIATLLAVVQQLGEVKRSEEVESLSKPILYSFFHGESWDYIGSSRMAYDMSHDSAFPENEALPRLSLTDIGHFLELGQLGSLVNKTVYVHGDKGSDFVEALRNVSDGLVLVKNSSRKELPPASLQRFIRDGVKRENEGFTGTLLTSFDTQFNNRFFGSRYDDANNFDGRSFDEVADDLADVATAVTKAVFRVSGPSCVNDCDSVEASIAASAELIRDVLECFLVNTSCDRFRSVFISFIANNSLLSSPLSRYVTIRGVSNLETVIVKQLVANFTANNATQLTTPVKCSECLHRIVDKNRDMTLNITWMQYSDGDSPEEEMCLCVESFTYTHSAVSPVFDYGVGYDSTEYSTWAESEWVAIRVRLYLTTYSLEEVGFLVIGLLFTVLTLIVSIQCTRKGDSIFQAGRVYDVVTT